MASRQRNKFEYDPAVFEHAVAVRYILAQPEQEKCSASYFFKNQKRPDRPEIKLNHSGIEMVIKSVKGSEIRQEYPHIARTYTI